jgi:hypothetical protein
MFALQVDSNFFWMFKSLLGLSTQGTFKTLTMVTSIASVVSLPMVMAVALGGLPGHRGEQEADHQHHHDGQQRVENAHVLR